MKPKKEDQNVNTLVLLKRANKILTGRNMETQCGSETEEKAIQRLPYLGIRPHSATNHGHYYGCWEVLAKGGLI